MKIICRQSVLLNNINLVLKAASGRTTLPILQCILLKADDGVLKLTGNDLELGVETKPFTAEVMKPGGVALEARMLSEIMRRLPDDNVLISVDERNLTTIQCGKVEFKIAGLPEEDFPYIQSVEKENKITIPEVTLKNMIKQTLFSVAQEENKPVFTGELLEVKNGQLNLVSVDGFRVSLRTTKLETAQDKTVNIVIPGKTLGELVKIMSDEADLEVNIYFTDKHVLFELSNCVVVSRLLEGEFLKYDQVFTTDHTTLVNASKDELLQSLERASLISRDIKKNPVKLEIGSGSGIILSSQTETGTSREEIEVEMDGSELTIAFNPKYLIDALKVIDDERILIKFTTSLSPCTISAVEGDDYKYLVLPLKLNI